MVRRKNPKKQKTSNSKNSDEQKVLLDAINDPWSAARKLTKNSLFMFLRYFWPIYSEDKFVPNWHIEYICKELEQVARRVAGLEPSPYDLIVNVPPGTSKTAITSIFFPVWCWVNWHHFRFITASYSSALSLESAEYSREIVRSEAFRQLYPEIDIKQDKDTKSNFRVIKREFMHKGHPPRQHVGGNRFSTSVGGAVTGFHGHIQIIDDPLDPQRAISEAEVRKANFWIDNVMPFRKTDKLVTPMIMIMQRLHQNDPTGYLLKNRPETVKNICLPGEIRNFKNHVRPPELVEKYKDQLLDPVRLTWDVLEKYRKIGQYTYSGQVGQTPVPLGGGMFETDMIRSIPTWPREREMAEAVRYWDKAGTEGGDGAYTAGVLIVKMKPQYAGPKFIVLDVVRGRWATHTRERKIKLIAEADRDLFIPHKVSYRVAIEQEPGSGGKESAQATIRNLAGFHVIKDLPKGDKTLRADPFSVQCNDGNVGILDGKPWENDYVDELCNFPNSTYKDQVDASAGGFSVLTQRKRVSVGRKHYAMV